MQHISEVKQTVHIKCCLQISVRHDRLDCMSLKLLQSICIDYTFSTSIG